MKEVVGLNLPLHDAIGVHRASVRVESINVSTITIDYVADLPTIVEVHQYMDHHVVRCEERRIHQALVCDWQMMTKLNCLRPHSRSSSFLSMSLSLLLSPIVVTIVSHRLPVDIEMLYKMYIVHNGHMDCRLN